MISEISKDMKNEKCTYFDAACHNQGGSLIVGASSLSHRLWTGKLQLYKLAMKDAEDFKYTPTFELETDSSVSNVKSLSKVNRIISTFDSGNVSLWELDKNEECLSLLTSEDEHDGFVTDLTINKSETKFITTGSDNSVKLWNADEFVPLSTYNAHADGVSGASFHHDNDEILLTCSEDSKVFLWDLRNSKPVISIGDLGSNVPTSMSWMPLRPDQFVVGTKSGSILVMDIRTMSVIKSLDCCCRSITSIYFSPLRPALMALSSQDTSVEMYSSEVSNDFQKLMKDNSHNKSVQEVSWNPVNGALISCSWDGSIKTHQVKLIVGDS